MSSMPDSLDIIRSFLTQPEARHANDELRITATLYARQLLDRNSRTIATMAHSSALDTDPASVVSVRRETEFWPLLNQCLQEAGFAPQEVSKQSGFITFKQLAIPEGYQLRLTEARFMWRTWWTQQRGQRRNLGLQMQLLIRARDNWYPVQDVACNQGTLFIRTLVGEMALQGSDQVVWLERKGSAPMQPRGVQQTAQASQTSPSYRSQPQATQSDHSRPGNTQIRDTSAGNTQINRSGTPSASHYPIPGSASLASQNRNPQGDGKADRISISISSSETTPTDLPSIPAEWQSVVRQTAGKLYIRTEKGYIVVKGEQLSIVLQPHQATTQSSNLPPGSPSSNMQTAQMPTQTSASANSTNTSSSSSSILNSRRRFFR